VWFSTGSLPISGSSPFDDDLFFVFISSSFFMAAPHATAACGARRARGSIVASVAAQSSSFSSQLSGGILGLGGGTHCRRSIDQDDIKIRFNGFELPAKKKLPVYLLCFQEIICFDINGVGQELQPRAYRSFKRVFCLLLPANSASRHLSSDKK
jgi:hypothetical protein